MGLRIDKRNTKTLILRLCWYIFGSYKKVKDEIVEIQTTGPFVEIMEALEFCVKAVIGKNPSIKYFIGIEL